MLLLRSLSLRLQLPWSHADAGLGMLLVTHRSLGTSVLRNPELSPDFMEWHKAGKHCRTERVKVEQRINELWDNVWLKAKRLPGIYSNRLNVTLFGNSCLKSQAENITSLVHESKCFSSCT